MATLVERIESKISRLEQELVECKERLKIAKDNKIKNKEKGKKEKK